MLLELEPQWSFFFSLCWGEDSQSSAQRASVLSYQLPFKLTPLVTNTSRIMVRGPTRQVCYCNPGRHWHKLCILWAWSSHLEIYPLKPEILFLPHWLLFHADHQLFKPISGTCSHVLNPYSLIWLTATGPHIIPSISSGDGKNSSSGIKYWNSVVPFPSHSLHINPTLSSVNYYTTKNHPTIRTVSHYPNSNPLFGHKSHSFKWILFILF